MKSESGGIAYERIGAGEPLLLLHGTGGSRAHWKPLVDLLSPRRELLLVDLPGHGESDLPPEGVPPTPIGYAQLLAGLLDELGIDRVDAAGNSVGGWTALELAKLGRARAVVAINPAGLWQGRAPRSSMAQLKSQYRMGRAFAPLTPRLLRSSAGRTALLKGTMAKPQQVPPEEAIELTRTFNRTPGFKEHLAAVRDARFEGGGAIDVPVTVAWGEKDRLIPAKARRRDELPEHAQIVDLPDCGHVPMWDDPELVARTILDGDGGQAAAPEASERSA
jgi:pimeloyl-ACP methyl ester carboxylesterase